MHVLSELFQIQRLTATFRDNVANPSWGVRVWPKAKQQEMLAQLEMLGLESATVADLPELTRKVSDIFGDSLKLLVAPQRCEVCNDYSWEVVSMPLAHVVDVGPEHTRVCRSCLEHALRLF